MSSEKKFRIQNGLDVAGEVFVNGINIVGAAFLCDAGIGLCLKKSVRYPWGLAQDVTELIVTGNAF